jgi:hypothetical protein
MKEGLLWYDDNPTTTLEEKAAQAAVRHLKKLGRLPNICYVHPSALNGRKTSRAGDIRIAPLATVLRHHFWLGREQKPHRQPKETNEHQDKN